MIRHNQFKKGPSSPSHFAALFQTFRDSSKQKVLFVNHRLGGGSERHIQELASFLFDRMEVVTIRPFDSKDVILRMGTDSQGTGLRFSLPSHYKELLDLCGYLRLSRVHFHQVMGIHSLILSLAKDLGIQYDITLHDYYFINSNPALSDRHGRFCESIVNRDHLCAQSQSIPGNLSAAQWRERQTGFLESADRLFIPSEYTARLYHDYFPTLRPIVTWHPDWEKNAPYPNPRPIRLGEETPMRVASIGMLSKEKGADLFESCGKEAKRRQLPLEFHLIGYALIPLSRSIHVHGMYEDRELGRLISKIGPHVIWFPTQCPETYSYTLSAALKSGRPLVVPDIGAFGERVERRPLTWVEPWDHPIERWLKVFLDLREKMLELGNGSQEWVWQNQHELNKGFTYSSDYVITGSARQEKSDDSFVPDMDWFHQFFHWNDNHRREVILRYIFRMTRCPIVGGFLNLIPYNLRRQIKRLFSRKPIHEIMR